MTESLFLEFGRPSQWVAVLSYGDGSATIGIWGPFNTQAEAARVSELLPDAMSGGVWQALPLGSVRSA